MLYIIAHDRRVLLTSSENAVPAVIVPEKRINCAYIRIRAHCAVYIAAVLLNCVCFTGEDDAGRHTCRRINNITYYIYLYIYTCCAAYVP
jgi:hypothetical protein